LHSLLWKTEPENSGSCRSEVAEACVL